MALSHYEVLGVAPDADLATIRTAYRRRARETHPDLGGDGDEFAAVSTAWDVLSDPDGRSRYDSPRIGRTGDAAWGEDVAFDGPVPAPPPSADPPRRPRRRTRLGPTPDIDPFRSPPRDLPPLDDELALLPRPPAPATEAKSQLSMLVIAVGAVAAIVATESSHPGQGVGGGHAILPYVVATYWVVRRRKALALSPKTNRVTAAVFLWGTVGFFSAIAVASDVRLLSAEIQVIGGLLVALLTERHVWRARRFHAAAAEVRERRDLAGRWNRFLQARETYGETARIERGILSEWGQPSAVWALVSRATGKLLTSAPQEAPAAWLETLRRARVDVSEPVGH